jgi:hypothetical protein
MQMMGWLMQDAVIAGILCLLGFGAIVVAAIFAFKQKAYVDRNTQEKVTEIEVPLFGKLKTNTPAIALCFVAAVFGYFAYDLMKGRGPELVSFNGDVTIDRQQDVGVVMVGITSGSWIQPATPNDSSVDVPVKITVPNSWPSYTAFAFAVGSAKSRPALIGASLENPTFKLNIKP